MKSLSDIMSRHVQVLHLKDSLNHAEWMFKHHKVRHLPVLKGDKLIGMLSLTDLQRLSFADHFEDINEQEGAVDVAVYNMMSIAQIMTRQVETVQVDMSVKEVASILAQREFHALPVMDGQKLVGIVTTTDLIKLLADLPLDI